MNKYQKDGKLAPGISRSKRTPNGWSFPEEVKIDNFYNYSPNAEFAISPDGRVMVMSVQRMTTKGKRDLYVSFKKIMKNGLSLATWETRSIHPNMM
jgi:hypothetical protein